MDAGKYDFLRYKNPVVIDKICRVELASNTPKGRVEGYKSMPVCEGNNNLIKGVHSMALLPWVIASKRLPDEELRAYKEKYPKEECIEVIVMIKGTTDTTTLYYDGEAFEDEYGRPFEVTHWMPMPEPPEASE